MLDNTSKISLTLLEGGKYLVRPGRYSVAKVNVINGFSDNEVYKVLEPSKTIEEPQYKDSIKHVNLGWPFIENALTKPKLPKKRTERSKQTWDLVSRWNKMSDEDKILFACKKYAHDMGCEIIDCTLL
jgi:hypothetical protein